MRSKELNGKDQPNLVRGMLVRYDLRLTPEQRKEVIQELYPTYNMLEFKRREILTVFGDLPPLSENEKKFVIRHYKNYTVREISMMLNKQISQVYSLINARGLRKHNNWEGVKEVGES